MRIIEALQFLRFKIRPPRRLIQPVKRRQVTTCDRTIRCRYTRRRHSVPPSGGLSINTALSVPKLHLLTDRQESMVPPRKRIVPDRP